MNKESRPSAPDRAAPSSLNEDRMGVFLAAFYACEDGFTSSLQAGLDAALASPPAPAAAIPAVSVEPEPECCPACDGEGTMIVMSDGGPDAYEVTVDCSHCRGNQTLRAAYDGVVELLNQSDKKYHEAAAILYLGRAHPTAAKRLIELAEYAVKPNRQDEWLRDRLLALADMASAATPAPTLAQPQQGTGSGND